MASKRSGQEALPSELWIEVFSSLDLEDRWGERPLEVVFSGSAGLNSPGVLQVEGSFCLQGLVSAGKTWQPAVGDLQVATLG